MGTAEFREIRDATGMTLQEVANVTGKSLPCVKRYSNGSLRVPEDVAEKMFQMDRRSERPKRRDSMREMRARMAYLESKVKYLEVLIEEYGV
jgi:hypothetical protein